MVNSISFSSGLNTLFLIEETQVVAFPLASKKGVMVTKAEDQLVAATFNGLINKRKTKVTNIDTAKSQVQFYYSDQYRQAFLIIIDVEFDKGPNNTDEYKYRTFNYDLDKTTLVFKRVENKLTIFSFAKQVAAPDIDPIDP